MVGTTPTGVLLFGEIGGNSNTEIALMIFGEMTVLAITINCNH